MGVSHRDAAGLSHRGAVLSWGSILRKFDYAPKTQLEMVDCLIANEAELPSHKAIHNEAEPPSLMQK